MDRDPKNNEGTRDPIFLLQVARRQWTQIPDGMESDSESMYVDDSTEPPDWIKPFIDSDGNLIESEDFWRVAENTDNDHGWPMVYVEWRTESVFLTRDEGERFARATEHRYDKWRVYCLPCDGQLAQVLRDLPETQAVG